MRTDEESRPSPEALLKVAKAEEAENERAKLKVVVALPLT
jgi:hypothetical protein